MNKIFQVLIKNPLLIILPAAAAIVLFGYALVLFPDMSRIMDAFAEVFDTGNFEQNFGFEDVTFMLSFYLKVGVLSLILCALSVVFIAGYGNTQAAAVNGGKASFKIFFFGIRKFTGKVILSLLLLLGVFYAVGIVISIVVTPFTVAAFISTDFSIGSIMETQMVLQIVIMIVMTLLYPLILLWLPAIFLDRQDRVIACFKNGVRASRKNYLKLLPVTIIMMLPTLLMYITSDNVFTMLKSPFLYLMYPYQMIVTPLIVTHLFIKYDSLKKAG